MKVEAISDEVAVMGLQGLSTAMENASRGMSGQRDVTGGEGIGYRQAGRAGMRTRKAGLGRRLKANVWCFAVCI